MKTMISILAVAAVVQVGLAVWAFSGKTQLRGQAASSTLLNFDQSQIDHVTILGDDQTLVLTKQDGQWQTGEGFPLTAGKMPELLDKLSGLKYGLPVATSDAALKRFKVTEEDYERRIVLKNDDETVTELFLGTGSGVRKSHLRSAAQNAVYVADIGSYDLPVIEDEWQDKSLLQLAKDDITGIQLGDLSLRLKKETPDTPITAAKEAAANATAISSKPRLWEVASEGDAPSLNQSAINEALSTFETLRFSKVLGKAAKPDYQLDNPLLTLTLTHKHGERGYQLSKPKDSDDYVLKVTDRDEYFELSGFVGDGLVDKVSQEAWVIEPSVETTEQETMTADE